MATQTNPGASGSEAAAILLMLLGDDEAAEVLKRLEPEEVQQLGGAMYAVADVSEAEINGVLDSFVTRAKARNTLGFGTEIRIKGMMNRALGEERAGKMLSRITPATKAVALDQLKWMDAPAIASLIRAEHPQIAALVLVHVDPAKAAAVLEMMDDQVQGDLVYRVARMGPVTQEALADVEALLNRHVSTGPVAPPSQRGGAQEAAKIVNAARTATEQRVIRQLGKLDKVLARTIEEEMFVFDNLHGVDDKALGTILRAVENDILVVALKGADERLRSKIYACMSARAAQSIQDEIAERGPMRLAEVQEAQKAMLAVVRRMAADGTISLGGKDDDYV